MSDDWDRSPQLVQVRNVVMLLGGSPCFRAWADDAAFGSEYPCKADTSIRRRC